MDDLVTDSVNIDNYNQKLKLVNLVFGCLLGELSDGVIQVEWYRWWVVLLGMICDFGTITDDAILSPL